MFCFLAFFYNIPLQLLAVPVAKTTTIRLNGITAGEAISGSVVVEAVVTAQDVTHVTFDLAGPTSLHRTELAAPYSIVGDRNGDVRYWDTTTLPNGSYTVTITAYHTDDAIASLRVPFEIANPISTTIRLNGITAGEAISGSVVVEAVVTAQDVTHVTFDLAGPTSLHRTELGAPYSIVGDRNGDVRYWDTTTLPNGRYTLVVTAYHTTSQPTIEQVAFFIANTSAPPQTPPADAETPPVLTPRPLPQPNPDAPVYYVSRRGNNGDGRSWEKAWNELNRIDWSVIQPGAIILIDGGSESMTYHTTLVVRKSGNPEAPIYIMRATEKGHNGQVVIDGGRGGSLPYCDQAPTSWPHAGEQVRTRGVMIDQRWVIIDGRRWRGIKIQRHGFSGINLITGSANVTIRNVEITDNGRAELQDNGLLHTDGAGIKLTGNSITIERAIIYDNGQDAIQSASENSGISNLTIRESWFYNSAHPVFGDQWGKNSHEDADSCTHADGLQIYNGGGAQQDVLIEDSVLGPRLMQAIILGDSCSTCNNSAVSNLVVRNSLLHNVTNHTILMMAPGGATPWPNNWRIEHSTLVAAERANISMSAGYGHLIADSILMYGGVRLASTVALRDNCQWETGGVRVGPVNNPGFMNPLGSGNRELADFTVQASRGSACWGKGARLTSAQQLLNRPDS